MSLTSTQRAVNELEGPIRGRISELRSRVDHEAREIIDEQLLSLDDEIRAVAASLEGRRRPEVPIEVVHGTTYLQPPILFSTESPDGTLLEPLLEQLIAELEGKQEKEPSRETALVITNLEQALHWQWARGVTRGTVKVEITDPKRV